MLLLKAPYGHNRGTGVTLRFEHFKYELPSLREFTLLLLGFSCHPPAIKKIYNSLKYSGEYTCYLQAAWFRDQYYFLELILKKYYIDLDVFFFVSAKDKEEVMGIYNCNKDKYLNKSTNEDFILKLNNDYSKTGKEYLKVALERFNIECD